MKNVMKVAGLFAMAFAVGLGSANAGGLSSPPTQIKNNGKSLEQLFEQYKAKVAGNDSKSGELKSVSTDKDEAQKVQETDYQEINVLIEKLQSVDAYIGDGRADLERESCTSSASCQQYYAKLQLEDKWFEATKRGYASKGCEPSRKAQPLMSDSESDYFASVDPMLGSDEKRLVKTNPRLKQKLMSNKRVLASSSYSEEVCASYARDIFNSLNQASVKKLKIKKQAF